MLPCFKAKIQGRLGLTLLDTEATTNFVDRAFLEKQPGDERKEDSTTICLADGTARERCQTHQSLTIELGPSITTVRAIEMKLLHFDAILGIPWLLKARPTFDLDEQAILLNDEMVWPIHQVPREKLPENLTQDESEEGSSESEGEDVTPLKATTPEQLELKFDTTARLKQCIQQRMGREDDQRWSCGEANAAPPPRESEDVSTNVGNPTSDVCDDNDGQGVLSGADDFGDAKPQDGRDRHSGAAINCANVKTVAKDAEEETTGLAHAPKQLGGSDDAVKRHARRRFRRRRVVVLSRFDASDRKTSAGGQDVNGELAPPDPSDGATMTETRAVTTASLPKDHGRRSATGLKARALFIGLAGALVTALLLSAAPNQPEPTNDSFVAHTQGAMAPATWQEVYSLIAERNAIERGRRARAILERKRALSPVGWGAEDCGASIHSSEESSWEGDCPSDTVTMGNGATGLYALEHCPSCDARTYGWGSQDCGRKAREEGSAPAATNILGAWARSPQTKRLRRSEPKGVNQPTDAFPPASAAQPDDPWAGLEQPYWGGDWTKHQEGRWWGGAGEPATNTKVGAAAAAAVAAATAEGPAQVGDDPWEPHPWALRVQPAWGGSWA